MSQQDLDSLRRFAYDSLGCYVDIEDFSRSFGRKSIMWRITAPDKREYYLKRHEDRRHYFAEVRALDEWIPSLPGEPGWAVPKVLATADELGAVIITGLPGLILDEASVESTTRTTLFELAGRFACLLHSSEIDLSSLSPQAYTNEQIDRYLLLAEPHIGGATLKWVDSIVRRSNAWEGLAIVPIHCDYSPRNWIVCEGEALLGIID